MAEDFYDLESPDYYLVKGDTLLIKRSFYDEDGNPLDITGYNAKFSVIDPYTDEIIEMVSGETDYSKSHNDSVSGGEGIYFSGDEQLNDGTIPLTISNTNELVVLLNPADTSLLDAKVYNYDLEFSYNSDVTKFTPLTGRLIVGKESTPSV